MPESLLCYICLIGLLKKYLSGVLTRFGMGFGLIFDLGSEYRHKGMIDWLSLRLDVSLLPDALRSRLDCQAGRIVKISFDGELEWETSVWESIRSDTHQVSCRLGSYFELKGSPARVGLPNNVFGSLDVVYCADKMIAFVVERFGFKRSDLPSLSDWGCTRIDVTRNLFMQSEAEARQALLAMKQMPSGRQKVSYEENGVYVGKRSSHQTAKVYHKGQDAIRMQRQKKVFYTEEELALSQYLLRFELSLKSSSLRKLSKFIHWSQFTPQFLLDAHDHFFTPYISTVEVTDMGTLLNKLLSVAPTEGQAKAAYDFYLKIRQIGYEQAKASSTKRTFYRNRKHLMAAGLSLADLTKSNVLPLRTRPIVLGDAVCSWDDIKCRLKEAA